MIRFIGLTKRIAFEGVQEMLDTGACDPVLQAEYSARVYEDDDVKAMETE